MFPLGVSETDLSVVSIDFAADPHLLIFGESGSGKSAALRAIAASIIAGNAPEQARLVVIDYRRAMLGEVEGDHLIGYATSAGQAATLLASVAEYMQRRLPGPDVTPRQLRDRTWYEGPECFVLVDDYDLVASGSNPLAPLLEYLAQARDVGLHVIVARRSGGAARALFEPVIARLRELATPGLVLSGDRDEGVLVGTVRPQQLPPGRATYVNRRDGARMIQLAYLPPSESCLVRAGAGTDAAIGGHSGGDDRGRLGCGQREADLLIVGCGGEHDAEHVAVGRDQRSAGVAAADQPTDRVDVPGDRTRVVDVRAGDVTDVPDPRRLGIVRAVERISEHDRVGIGLRLACARTAVPAATIRAHR